MNTIKKMKLRAKIVTSFTVANVVLAICVALLIFFISTISTRFTKVYTDYGSPLSTLGKCGMEFYDGISNFKTAFISDNGNEIQAATSKAVECITRMQEYLGQLEEQLTDDDTRAAYTKAKALLADMSMQLAPVVEKLQSGNVVGARAEYDMIGVDTYEEQLTAGLDSMYDLMSSHAMTSLQECGKKVKKNTIGALVLMIVAILGITGVALLLGRSVRKPIQDLQQVAQRVAEGDVSIDVKKRSDDEIGALTDDLERMIKSIREQAEGVERVSRGDLTLDFRPKSDKDLLGNSIKDLVEMNNKTMNSIRSAVTEVRVGAGQVSSASQALAQGSTEQASAIQEITASIDDITERTRVNASDANEANTLVVKAKEDAEVGNVKMQDMISAMTEINDSSENISKIIKVIDDIAFQTNILALNAAVEAARAGQHGKGFAVVAEEVRNLAGKSAQAASETAELIEDSIVKVNRGSKLAEETAEALAGIVAAIERIVELTNSIAIASDDQASAISQINLAIGQVSQVVQNNSATSEQCAAASEELSAQAERLKDMIGRYQLKSVKDDEAAPRGFSSRSDDDDFEKRPAQKPVNKSTAKPSIDLGEEPEDTIIPYERGIKPDKADKPTINLEDDFGKY